MTCEKCGLVITRPSRECPRCGGILPQQKIEREGLEAGSIDSWNENAAESDTRGRRAMPTIPFVSKFVQKHPSALFYISALSMRIFCYIVSVLLFLFSSFSLWSGIGMIINVFVAVLAVIIIAIPPEDQDVYWFKPVSTILILLDACVVSMLWVLPFILKIATILFA